MTLLDLLDSRDWGCDMKLKKKVFLSDHYRSGLDLECVTCYCGYLHCHFGNYFCVLLSPLGGNAAPL